MALQIPTTTLSSGIEVKESYARIQSIDGDKEKMSLMLFYYKDHGSFAEGKAPFFHQQYAFEPSVADDAPNYHKQGYEFIKTLPDFANAIDC